MEMLVILPLPEDYDVDTDEVREVVVEAARDHAAKYGVTLVGDPERVADLDSRELIMLDGEVWDATPGIFRRWRCETTELPPGGSKSEPAACVQAA